VASRSFFAIKRADIPLITGIVFFTCIAKTLTPSYSSLAIAFSTTFFGVGLGLANLILLNRYKVCMKRKVKREI